MTASTTDIRRIAGDWEATFLQLLASANDRVLLCAPFISQVGAAGVARARHGKRDIGGKSLVLTDLSPRAVCAGATEPGAVASLRSSLSGSRLVHLPRLHAKVYIADGRAAIVTSGNLTSGGIRRNYEYGVYVDDPSLAGDIESDLLDYASLGADIDERMLANYCDVAESAKVAYAMHLASSSKATERRLSNALREADDALIRTRLAGGAMHTVFARTIEFLLRREGPLATVELHPLIQRIHPDLCDDSVDRVIDGHSFGKKWKHAVRTAQQQLKSAGKVALLDGRWRLTKT